MPVPSAITDLSTTPAINSPSGSESITTSDDYLRTLGSFIRQNYNRMTDGTGAIVAASFTGAHNGTVGATTPSTGAFTTLSASGGATVSMASTDAVLKVDRTTTSAGSGWLGSNTTYSHVFSNGALTNIGQLRITQDAPASAAVVSSTGLAVTGALSATGKLTTAGLTEDSSGNLGLGVTPSAWRTIDKALQVRSTVLESVNNTTAVVGLNYYRDSGGVDRYINSDFSSRLIFNNASNGSIAFSIAPSGTAGAAVTFTQAMTLDSSGNLLVNSATLIGQGQVGIKYDPATKQGLCLLSSAASSGVAIQFVSSVGSVIGSISNTTGATTYNTTSDHRLKMNQAPLTGSGAFIDALKPKVWTWATDGSAGAGFIAHEFQEVSPSSVTGTKDAVDENGAPVYQAMQASSAEVMANLVAEIQDLRRRLAAAGL